MPDHKIGTTIEVSGEQQYKRAIKEAGQALHTLGTELNLASAQFKADGDAMKLMESRSKALKAEIQAQERIVESAEKALREAAKQYGENSKQAEKWQATLNSAKARLLNFQQELKNNEQGLDKNGRAFDTAGKKAQTFGGDLKQVDSIQKGITFQALNTALTNIGGVFERVGQTASKAWKLVWNTASESSEWADDLATLSQQTGVSISELQKWAYAADYIDTDIGTITKAMQKLVNPSKDVLDVMKELGIHRKDAWLVLEDNGAVDSYETTKNSVDLFWELIDQMGQIYAGLDQLDDERRTATQASLETMAQSVFGKSFQEMLPLIKAGKEAWDEYGKQAEKTGNVLADNLIENLTGFNDSLQTLQNDFESFKNTFSASLAPGLKAAAEAMSGLLEQLTLWAQSPEGQKALGDLSTAISDLITSFTENINFSEVVDTATKAVTGFKDGLIWLKDNKEAVTTAIAAIGLALGGLTVTKEVLSFFALLKLGGGLLGKKGGATTGGGTPTSEGGPAAAGGSGLFAKLWGGAKTLATNAWNYAAPGVVTTAALFPAYLADLWDKKQITAELTEQIAQAEELEDEAAKDAVKAIAKARMPGKFSRVLSVLGTDMQSDLGAQAEALDSVLEQGNKLNLSGKTRLWLNYRNEQGGISMQKMDDLGSQIVKELLNPEQVSEAFDDLQDAAGNLKEAFDRLDEEGITPETKEGFLHAFDLLLESPKAWRALPEATQKKLAEYAAPESGYGADSATQFSDALELYDEVMQVADEQIKEIHTFNATYKPLLTVGASNPFNIFREALKIAFPDPAEDTYRRAGLRLDVAESDLSDSQYESLRLFNPNLPKRINKAESSVSAAVESVSEEIAKDFAAIYSDAADWALEALENYEDDPTNLENEAELYSLIRKISDSDDIKSGLTDETIQLLNDWLDPDSGFGNGSAGIAPDSVELLTKVAEDLNAAFYEAMENDNTSAESAGQKLTTALVTGIESGVESVTAAASGLAAAVAAAVASAAVPGVPRASGGQTNNSYSNNSSLVIERFNNYSGSDANALLAAMNRQNRYNRMGRGA